MVDIVSGGNFQVVWTIDIVLGKVEYHQQTVEDTRERTVQSLSKQTVIFKIPCQLRSPLGRIGAMNGFLLRDNQCENWQ